MDPQRQRPTNTTRVGVFLIDNQQRIVHVEPVAAELLGWRTPEEIVGRRCWEVMQGRDLNGANPCTQDCLPLQLLRSGGAAPKWVLSRNPAGGAARWLNFCHLQGLEDLVVHLVQDVTEEQEALRLYSALRAVLLPESGARSAGATRDSKRILTHSLGLTEREVDIVTCLARGQVNSDIARELFLSRHTVNNHVRRILEKLGLHHRAEVVPYMLRHIITAWVHYSASGETIDWLFSPGGGSSDSAGSER